MSKRQTKISILKQGLTYLLITLPLMFLSPYLLTLSFLNKEDAVIFWMILPLGAITGMAAIFLWYKGIMTIMKSLY